MALNPIMKLAQGRTKKAMVAQGWDGMAFFIYCRPPLLLMLLLLLLLCWSVGSPVQLEWRTRFSWNGELGLS